MLLSNGLKQKATAIDDLRMHRTSVMADICGTDTSCHVTGLLFGALLFSGCLNFWPSLVLRVRGYSEENR